MVQCAWGRLWPKFSSSSSFAINWLQTIHRAIFSLGPPALIRTVFWNPGLPAVFEVLLSLWKVVLCRYFLVLVSFHSLCWSYEIRNICRICRICRMYRISKICQICKIWIDVKQLMSSHQFCPKERRSVWLWKRKGTRIYCRSMNEILCQLKRSPWFFCHPSSVKTLSKHHMLTIYEEYAKYS